MDEYNGFVVFLLGLFFGGTIIFAVTLMVYGPVPPQHIPMIAIENSGFKIEKVEHFLIENKHITLSGPYVLPSVIPYYYLVPADEIPWTISNERLLAMCEWIKDE